MDVNCNIWKIELGLRNQIWNTMQKYMYIQKKKIKKIIITIVK